MKQYTMAQEASATRANTDAKTQAIMDKLCQLEMDGMRTGSPACRTRSILCAL